MHEVVVKVGDTITFPSQSVVALKLMAVNGRLARVLITDPDAKVSREADPQGKILKQQVAAGVGGTT